MLRLQNLEVGDYTFTLKVTDTARQTSTADVHVFVKPGNWYICILNTVFIRIEAPGAKTKFFKKINGLTYYWAARKEDLDYDLMSPGHLNQGVKSPTFSYFFTFLLLFPTFD